ncbi:hypothetical protein F4778DRAFT_750718, partial [Xylariomycetidae sp. FL2044]
MKHSRGLPCLLCLARSARAWARPDSSKSQYAVRSMVCTNCQPLKTLQPYQISCSMSLSNGNTRSREARVIVSCDRALKKVAACPDCR